MCKSKKVKYFSEKEAVDSAVYLSLKAQEVNHPQLYPYKCPFCDGWHLSSRSGLTKKQKKNLKYHREFILKEAEHYSKYLKFDHDSKNNRFKQRT